MKHIKRVIDKHEIHQEKEDDEYIILTLFDLRSPLFETIPAAANLQRQLDHAK